MADVETTIFIQMFWTPAKILLLADVDECSFANAVEVSYHIPDSKDNWINID